VFYLITILKTIYLKIFQGKPGQYPGFFFEEFYPPVLPFRTGKNKERISFIAFFQLRPMRPAKQDCA
jgi:hypothetical protein